MGLIGLEAIGCYRPEQSLDVFELGKTLAAKDEFIRSKLGFVSLARKPADMESSDMCVEAFRRLPITIDPDSIDCLVVVSQNPDRYGLPHTSCIVQHKLELSPHIACFDISLGCSGFVQGLSVVTAFMEAQGLKRGLLFTADPYSKVIDLKDRNTAMLFGDAAACTVLSDRPLWTAGKTLHFTSGKVSRAINVNDARTLTMEGNLVFQMVARSVPGQIKECIEANGLGFEDIDLFLVHQGSKYIVDTLRKRLKLAPEKMPFAAADIGNTVSSSLPLLLADNTLVGAARRLVLSGFGVGLQSATTVLTRKS